MAANEEVLRTLLGQTAGMSAADIAKEMGVKTSDIANPLKRMLEKEPPWISKNEQDEYELTPEGKKKVVAPTDESEAQTEYQQFLKMGLSVGVTDDAARVAAGHVWNAGDYYDLNWVLEGLTQQGIRRDLRERWFHLWRGYLAKPITPALRDLLDRNRKNDDTTPSVVTDSKDAKVGIGGPLRDYILDAHDNVLYVGEGLGNMEYADAVKISTLRAAAASRIQPNAADVNGSKGGAVSDAIAIIDAINKANGGNGAKKTLLMVPGENGYTLQEVDAGSSVVIPRTEQKVIEAKENPQGVWYMDPNDNIMKQAAPGQPIVIIKKEPSAGVTGGGVAPRSYLYKEDGTMVEFDPTKPIVIKQAPPAQSSITPTMLNAVTADGKQIVIDIDSYFKLEDHKQNMEQKREKHEMNLDFLKTVKDFASKSVKALGRMNGDEEEETE